MTTCIWRCRGWITGSVFAGTTRRPSIRGTPPLLAWASSSATAISPACASRPPRRSCISSRPPCASIPQRRRYCTTSLRAWSGSWSPWTSAGRRLRLSRAVAASLAPYYLHLFAPALVQGDQLPLHARREVVQYLLRCGMDAQGGRDEIQLRRGGREAHAGEIAVALELAQAKSGGVPRIDGLRVVPANTDPVIQPLQRQMQVVISFQLNDRQPAIPVHGQQIEHSAIVCRKRRHLRISVRGVEVCVDCGHVAAQHALQPAFGLRAIQDVALASVRLSPRTEPRNQLSQLV